VATALELPLKGPKGEPVDLFRTIMSHGVADLPPGHVDEEAAAYTTTLALPSAQPRTIRILAGRPGFARVEVQGRKLGARGARDLTAAVRQILNLDRDLSEFYALVANDPDLSWVSRGAGRMLRAPTVFEDVVKTICTLVRTANRGIAPVIRRKSASRWLPLPLSSPRKEGGLRMPSEFQIPLRGPSGEPVDLVRTFMSHGVADLLPGRVDEAARSYTTTLALPRTQPRTIRISEGVRRSLAWRSRGGSSASGQRTI